jgi:hypothetical protein
VRNGGSSSAERLRIDSSGNVGVNCTPNNYSANHRSITLNGPATPIIDLEVNGTRTGSIVAESTKFDINAVTSVPIRLLTADTERFRIGTAGQLGIGGATYGTSGQVLTSGGSGAAPTWADAGGGAYELVSTTNISSNVSSLEFQNFSSSYKSYKLILCDVGVTGTTQLYARYLNGSSEANTGDYVTAGMVAKGNNSFSSGGTNSNNEIYLTWNSIDGHPVNNPLVISGFINLFRVDSDHMYGIAEFGFSNGTGADDFTLRKVSFKYLNSQSVDGFKIFPSSGSQNFSSGTVKLYRLS